jgi:hypothetical protein
MVEMLTVKDQQLDLQILLDWRDKGLVDEKLLDKAFYELARHGVIKITEDERRLKFTRWGFEKMEGASLEQITEYLTDIQEKLDDGHLMHEVNSEPFRGGKAIPIAKARRKP